MIVTFFGALQTTRRRVCNDSRKTKKGKYCILQQALRCLQTSLFLLVLVLLLLLIFHLLSRVFTGVKDIKTKKNNGRDQRLQRSNLGRGNNGCVFCSFSFVFSSFLFLTLLPDYLLYHGVGFDRRHGG